MWQHLRLTLGANWRPQRHEDRQIGPGVPDVSFVMRRLRPCETGWLELKRVNKLDDKNNVIGHFTSAQEQWLLEHFGLGIPVFLLLLSDADNLWLWFEGDNIGRVQGSSKHRLTGMADFTGIGHGIIDFLVSTTAKDR